MSEISFKKFLTFVDIEGAVSDEQITEIFGVFKNNAKIQKLQAERERLKNRAGNSAQVTSKKAPPAGTDDDDLTAALDLIDRKGPSKYSGEELKQIAALRKKFGITESTRRNAKNYT